MRDAVAPARSGEMEEGVAGSRGGGDAPALESSVVSGPSLESAYAHCASVVRSRARNFYYGLRLTPEPKRSAVYSVYAWMRRADDITDDATTPERKRAALGAFSRTTERLIEGAPLDGGARECPVWTAFGETYRRYGLEPGTLRSLIEGLEWDIEVEGREGSEPVLLCTERADLERYCYCVASTVGLICIRIWGLRNGVDTAEADRLAVKRGLAFQLTNILRDFGEDYDSGRVYLPASEFEGAQLTPAQLRTWARPAECARVLGGLASWARSSYTESAPLDDMVDPSCGPGLRAMTAIYAGLLGVIEDDPSRVVGTRRVRLQSATKAGIAIRALVGGWLGRRAARTGATA